jgi:hypothetical protein
VNLAPTESEPTTVHGILGALNISTDDLHALAMNWASTTIGDFSSGKHLDENSLGARVIAVIAAEYTKPGASPISFLTKLMTVNKSLSAFKEQLSAHFPLRSAAHIAFCAPYDDALGGSGSTTKILEHFGERRDFSYTGPFSSIISV